MPKSISLPLGVVGQSLPLRPLDLLELVDFRAFAVLAAADAVGEELLKIGVAHEIILGLGPDNLILGEEKRRGGCIICN